MRLHEMILARRVATRGKQGDAPRPGRPARANLLRVPLPKRLRLRTPLKGPERRDRPPAFPVAAARTFRFRSSVPGQRPALHADAPSKTQSARWARFKS